MLQRWMKSMVVFAATTVLFTACKKEYSKDEPLPEEFKPSLFISSQNEFLYALEPKTGNKIWEYYIGTNVQATPVIIGDFLFLPTEDTLIKLDAKRGTVVKKYNFLPDHNVFNFLSSPTAGADGMLYIGSVNGHMYAMNAAADQIKWDFDAQAPINSSPTLIGNQLVFAAGGKLFSLNASNGSTDWTFTAGNFASSPTISGDNIFIGSDDNNLYVISLKTGALKWQYLTGGFVQSSPIAVGGNVIFGSNDEYLYCVDTAAKIERWKFKTDDRIISSPLMYGQNVYFGSYDYYFYALNIIDGSLKWRYKTQKLIKSSPVSYEGAIFFGSYDKTMYAMDTSGYLLWSRNVDGIIQSSPVIWDLNKATYPSISGLSSN